MKTILLTLTISFVLGFFNLLNAQDRWEYVCTKGDNNGYYDKESITYYNNYIDVWIKFASTNSTFYMLNFERYYCGTRKVIIMETIVYGSETDVPTYHYDWEYHNIIPETIQECLYNTICN